jgi:hypothetical protein
MVCDIDFIGVSDYLGSIALASIDSGSGDAEDVAGH